MDAPRCAHEDSLTPLNRFLYPEYDSRFHWHCCSGNAALQRVQSDDCGCVRDLSHRSVSGGEGGHDVLALWQGLVQEVLVPQRLSAPKSASEGDGGEGRATWARERERERHVCERYAEFLPSQTINTGMNQKNLAIILACALPNQYMSWDDWASRLPNRAIVGN